MRLRKQDYDLIHSIDFIHRKVNIDTLKSTIVNFNNTEQFIRPFQRDSQVQIVANLVTGDQYFLTFCKEDWDEGNIEELENNLSRYLRDYNYSTTSEIIVINRNGTLLTSLNGRGIPIQIRNDKRFIKILHRARTKSQLVNFLPSDFDNISVLLLISNLKEEQSKKESRLEIEFNFPEDLYESKEELVEYFFEYIEGHEYLFKRRE